MSARLTLDERAELERLRAENVGLREEVLAWKDRRSSTDAEPLHVGPITLWPDQARVEVDGRSVHLTGRQRTLLECLARRKNATVTKDSILDFLYGGLDEPEAKIVDVMVCAVRRKLREFGADRHLQTVWGVGYRLSDQPAEGAYTRAIAETIRRCA